MASVRAATEKTGSRSPHIFISCGEASGDRYGASLSRALQDVYPEVRISAMGGSALAAAGAEMVAEASSVAVMGFTEIIGALPRLLRTRQRVWNFIRSESVDLVVPIDFPGFNGMLAGHSQSCRVPVFWLVAPQLWAWGGWRAAGYRRKIDRLGTILPFETKYFSERGFSVFPMGNPLMDDYAEDFPFEANMGRREKALNSRKGELTIGVLPGSRRQELAHLLPTLKVACQTIMGHLPGRNIRFVVSVAPGVDPVQISSVFDGQFSLSNEPMPDLLERLDLAMVCSGTASLEASLAGVPHEIVYRTGAVNAFLAKRLLRTKDIGLSNLIMQRRIVREHVQAAAAPLPLARDLLRWLVRPAERQAFYADARRLRTLCGTAGVWQRTAVEIREFLDNRSEQQKAG